MISRALLFVTLKSDTTGTGIWSSLKRCFSWRYTDLLVDTDPCAAAKETHQITTCISSMIQVTRLGWNWTDFWKTLGIYIFSGTGQVVEPVWLVDPFVSREEKRLRMCVKAGIGERLHGPLSFKEDLCIIKTRKRKGEPINRFLM